jgi:prolyl 4-hydroxylase
VAVVGGDQVVITPQGGIEMPEKRTTSTVSSSTSSYGVDISWPMQHAHATDKDNPFGKSTQDSYANFISGCEKQADNCQDYESDRLEMNLLQPSAMQNYTYAGYAKVPAPAKTRELLETFWAANQGREKKELWDSGNTVINTWEAPTFMLNMGRNDLAATSEKIRRDISRSVQAVLEAWTHQSLVLTSMYGIRIYKEGAILAPHVDRLPLVISAIINVAQDVTEPWVLEVIGHDGQARNLTMQPGKDMFGFLQKSRIEIPFLICCLC